MNDFIIESGKCSHMEYGCDVCPYEDTEKCDFVSDCEKEINQELKLCPFCGHKAHIDRFFNGYRVVCNCCEASTVFMYNKEKVIEAWNARKPMEQIVEQIVEQFDKASDCYECEEQGREHVPMIDLIDAIEIVRKAV